MSYLYSLSFNISLFLFLQLAPCSLDTFAPLSTSRSLLTVLTKITSPFLLSSSLVVLLIPNSFSKLEVSLSTSLPNSSVFPSFILYLSLALWLLWFRSDHRQIGHDHEWVVSLGHIQYIIDIFPRSATITATSLAMTNANWIIKLTLDTIIAQHKTHSETITTITNNNNNNKRQVTRAKTESGLEDNVSIFSG